MNTTKNISNSDDVIDSRDVIARIEELRGIYDSELEGLRDAARKAGCEVYKTGKTWNVSRPAGIDRVVIPVTSEYSATLETPVKNGGHYTGSTEIEALRAFAKAEMADSDIPTTLDEGEFEELAALLALQEQAEPYAPDWKYGATLIRDSYFKEYAQELAEDIGAIGKDMQWPLMHIDWEAAAEALKVDYTSVEFDGVEYWVRS